MQCSDWEDRPLSENQLQYAALDAWVLLPVLGRLLAMDVECVSHSTIPHASDHSELARVSLARAERFSRRFRAASDDGVCSVAKVLEVLGVPDAHTILVPSHDARFTDEPSIIICKTLACVAITN